MRSDGHPVGNFTLSDPWVRIPAEAYAERLFESCAVLKSSEDDTAQ